MECTVLIPTYNRPNHLKRILSYYNQYGNDLPIVIADSSSEENKKLNRETVSSFHNPCFSYLDKYDPSINPLRKILDAFKQVSTMYCVFCADDDFVTPSGIRESIEFLDNNPDYTTAYGKGENFLLQSFRGSEPQFRYLNYRSHSNTYVEPKDRLIYEVANYNDTSYYAVRRTLFMKMLYEEVSKATTIDTYDGKADTAISILFGELIISWLSAIYGKMKCLDTLFCVREYCTPAKLVGFRPALSDLMKDKSYGEKKQKFSDCVAGHLYSQSGISKMEAYKIIDKAIMIYAKKSNPLARKISIILNNLNLPDWLDRGIRKLYHWLDSVIIQIYQAASRICSSGNSAYPVNSRYRNDLNQIRLCILANAEEIYGVDASSKPY